MKKRLKILLVEDNPGDAELIRDLLSESSLDELDLQQVERLQQAIKQIDENSIDVILLDLGPPGGTGLDKLSGIIDYTADVPVIVLAGLADEETGIKAINKGAEDYLIKGLINADVVSRVIRCVTKRIDASR